MARRRRLAVVAVGAAVAFSVAGCADDGVATLGGSGAGEVRQAQAQARRAEAMAACLADAGIPVTLIEYDRTQRQVGIDSERPYVLSPGDGSTRSFFAASDDVEVQRAAVLRLAETVARYDREAAEGMLDRGEGPVGEIHYEGESATPPIGFQFHPYLVIDEQDHTAPWLACLTETGYTEPGYEADPADELARKQFAVEAGVRWATCARENGYPTVADPDQPVADNNTTTPTVALPTTITEEQLRGLLAACPNFDPDGVAELEAAYAALGNNPSPEEMRALVDRYPTGVEPIIGFDAPGWDGRGGHGADLDQATGEHLRSLTAIVGEARESYYQTRETQN
jgi:hypothetical protein